MHIFLPSSLPLALTKVSCTSLLTTLETYPCFSFNRDAIYSYPQYSNSMRQNDIIACILLLKLPFIYYNTLSRIRLRIYSNIFHYIVDVRYQIDSQKLPITSYFFLFNPFRLIQILISLYSLLISSQSYLSNPTFIKLSRLNLVQVIYSLTPRIYYNIYYISLDFLILL